MYTGAYRCATSASRRAMHYPVQGVSPNLWCWKLFARVALLLACVGCAGDDAGGAAVAGSDLCTSCGGCAEALPVTSRLHVTGPLEYPDPPPVGGDHDPCWAPWGVHSEAVPPRNWVHNLEHGGVVFLYNCPDGCSADLEAFAALARANQRTLLTPYADLPARFALVAWGHRILSACVDKPVFQAFYDMHFDHGPESLASDPPAECL